MIFPDISATSMSLLLDYIYTGSVIVYSNMIQEFLSVACILKIHLDLDPADAAMSNCKLFHKSEQKYEHGYIESTKAFKAEEELIKSKDFLHFGEDGVDTKTNHLPILEEKKHQTLNGTVKCGIQNNLRLNNNNYPDRSLMQPKGSATRSDETECSRDSTKHIHDETECSRDGTETKLTTEVFSKTRKKLPELLPICYMSNNETTRSPKKMCRYVLPSPWLPRMQTVFGDPRINPVQNKESMVSNL